MSDIREYAPWWEAEFQQLKAEIARLTIERDKAQREVERLKATIDEGAADATTTEEASGMQQGDTMMDTQIIDRLFLELSQVTNATTQKELSLLKRVRDMETRKDDAYTERNRCVALVARMAVAMNLPVAVTKTAIEGWSEDWHGCIYIELPTGQVSWHFHDSQAHLFDGLPQRDEAWDGHDTPEKYRRVDAAFRAEHCNEAALTGGHGE